MIALSTSLLCYTITLAQDLRISVHLTLPIDAILVPQGAEYQAVCQGLSQILSPKPLVVPIPVGPKPTTQYLDQWLQTRQTQSLPQTRVLLMGLCGSLSPDHAIGDIVLYQDCLYVPPASAQLSNLASRPQLQECDREFTHWLHSNLKEQASVVRSLTCDRIIRSSAEKHQLHHSYDASVVDMEGFAVLNILSQAGIAVAMVRVVSDESHYNLPDLNSALNSDGSLEPFPLAISLLREPVAAIRLIRGALRGLKVLQQLTLILLKGQS